tara:strand:- start:736 stop:927 length:192 start_codon:yes stop_codon:yes gene_type:complete
MGYNENINPDGTPIRSDEWVRSFIGLLHPHVYPPKKVKVGRNAPCPCQSGKKYKKCCITKGGK